MIFYMHTSTLFQSFFRSSTPKLQLIVIRHNSQALRCCTKFDSIDSVDDQLQSLGVDTTTLTDGSEVGENCADPGDDGQW